MAVRRPSGPKRNLTLLRRKRRNRVDSEVDGTTREPTNASESGPLVQRQRGTAPVGRGFTQILFDAQQLVVLGYPV